MLGLFLVPMQWTEQIRQRLAARLPVASRPLKGHSMRSARRVGLVYSFEDERSFNEVRRLAEAMAKEHDVEVIRFTYVDLAKKDIPHWMLQLPQSRFIAKEDVNLLGRPHGEADGFCAEPLDLLINLETSLHSTLLHVVRNAQASMKVAIRQPVRNEDYDILFEPVLDESLQDRMRRMTRFLSNTQLT